MFENLTDRLSSTFSKLRGKGLITEQDVTDALREMKRALLEADVALPVVKHIQNLVQERAVGDKILKSVTPGQQVIKVVHDAILEVLGDAAPLNLNVAPPAIVLVCGLQGSGKTTTTGKLAKYLVTKDKKSVLVASLDVYRPAAQAQLATLAEQAGVESLPIVDGEKPLDITKRALNAAKKGSYDVLFLDTAGRTELDDALMAELVGIKELANPSEILLVADALTGQTAVEIATAFKDAVDVTGLVLTRMDGDGRGGAALSMRYVTGVPIKYIGLGERLTADDCGLDVFRPEGIASRILGEGDVVALVDKMQAAVNEDDAAAFEEKMMSGQRLDMNDLKKQFKMMQKMGGMGGMLKLLPGMGKIKNKLDEAKMDNKVLIHQTAIIDSMTKAERVQPEILNAKRRKRIAAGCGLEVSDVNKLVKMYEQMAKMTKMMKKQGGMAGMMNMLNQGKGRPF